MSDFSDETALIALETIEEFGQTAVFTRNAKGAYSTTAQTHISSTPTTYSVSVLPYESKVNSVNGDTILQVVKQLLTPNTDTSGTTFAPIEGDFVAFNGVTYRVQQVQDPVKVNGVSVLYILIIGI